MHYAISIGTSSALPDNRGFFWNGAIVIEQLPPKWDFNPVVESLLFMINLCHYLPFAGSLGRFRETRGNTSPDFFFPPAAFLLYLKTHLKRMKTKDMAEGMEQWGDKKWIFQCCCQCLQKMGSDYGHCRVPQPYYPITIATISPFFSFSPGQAWGSDCPTFASISFSSPDWPELGWEESATRFSLPHEVRRFRWKPQQQMEYTKTKINK